MLMKKQAATLLILMLVGLTGLAKAQASAIIKAQVPFKFVVNGTTMPAGECIIRVLVHGQALLLISSGKQHVFALPIADQSPRASRGTALVFRRHGERYILAGITHAGRMGYDFPASRLERELRRQNVAEEVFTLPASATVGGNLLVAAE